MRTTSDVKACDACARSKRRCGKELPACQRCVARKRTCVYTVPKPSSFVLLAEEEAALVHPPQQQALQVPPPLAVVPDPLFYYDPLGLDDDALRIILGYDVVPSSSPLPAPAGGLGGSNWPMAGSPFDSCREQHPPAPALASRCAWFLDQSTWAVSTGHTKPLSAVSRRPDVLVDRIFDTIKSWLCGWVSEGSCPFVHSTLYSDRMPTCVADAYSTLALCGTRTPGNRIMQRRLIHERMLRLVHEGPCPGNQNHPRRSLRERMAQQEGGGGGGGATVEAAGEAGAGGATVLAEGREVLVRLARVQALLVYQLVGFFDGEICLRRHAESVVPTLDGWLDGLLGATRAATSSPLLTTTGFDGGASPAAVGLCGDARAPPTPPEASSVAAAAAEPDGPAGTIEQEEMQWRLWAVAESVRRTWTVAHLAQAAYTTAYSGDNTCRGRLPLTLAAGAWDAPSSFAWRRSLNRAGEDPAGKAQRLLDVRDLLAKARADEVDEFGKLAGEASFGLEAMERWGVDMSDTS